MAEAEVPVDDISLTEMLDKLMMMTQEVPNDRRQDEYCRYINIILREYGQERCEVIGSTKEGTRLRSEQDEGDFDYILIGDVTVPVECLEYKEDLPCFVHIKGSFFEESSRKELIDGIYVPTSLVKNVSPLFFPRVKGIFDFVCRSQTSYDRHTPHAAFRTSMKPGYTLTNYAGFQSDAFNVTKKHRSANNKTLLKQFNEQVKDSEALTGGKGDVLISFGTVVDFIQSMKTKETSDGLVYQQLGPLLSALSGNVSGMPMKRPNEEGETDTINITSVSNDTNDSDQGTEHIRQKKAKTDPKEKDIDIEMTETTTTEESTHVPLQNEQVSVDMSQRSDGNDDQKSVRVTYRSKSKKDFIPAIRLSGPHKFMTEWMARERSWPEPNVVDEIMKTEFLVVAKQALINEIPELDFCLSCNFAEIKLAKAMPDGYKKCLLMIKAFQRSTLEEFSEILTTFHWKTAIFRILEQTTPSTIQEGNKEVLHQLKTVLDFMRDCLHVGFLEHYFIPSNLFAGMEAEIRISIIGKIEEIYHDPVLHLKYFFCQESERSCNPKMMEIPYKDVTEMKKVAVDKKDETNLEAILKGLESFAQPVKESNGGQQKQPSFQNMLMNIANEALVDDKNTGGSSEDTSGVGLSTVSKADLLSDLQHVFDNQGADRKTKKEAREKLKQDAISFFLSGGKFKY